MILELKDAEKYKKEHPEAELTYLERGYFEVKNMDSERAGRLKMREEDFGGIEKPYEIVDDGENLPAYLEERLKQDQKYGVYQEEDKIVIEEIKEEAEKEFKEIL